jgi:Asp-tRNA(Asn)/Glu-tRNA(Gln) amidotransferase A subunit family amidase
MALVRYTCLFNHTDQPVISMPSAIAENGIPSSVQLVGNLRADAAIIDLAIKLEQALELRLSFEVNDAQR